MTDEDSSDGRAHNLNPGRPTPSAMRRCRMMSLCVETPSVGIVVIKMSTI